MTQINRVLEKWLPLLTPAAVMAGVLLSNWLQAFVYLVPFIFAFITFSSSLGIHPRDLSKVALHPFPLLLGLIIIQLVMPSLAFLTGHALFSADPETIHGLVLAFAIPTGVVSLMWVTIYQGNRSLTLAIILVNTLLSPILVPFILRIFIGTAVEMDTVGMMSSLFWMIVLPSIAGILLHYALKDRTKLVGAKLAPLSKLCLLTVIALNSSVAAPYFKALDARLFAIIFVVFVLATVGYLIGMGAARLFKLEPGSAIGLMFNCGMRNIGAGAALAVLYFPPATMLPVIAGTLFQQILAALFGKVSHSQRIKKEQMIAAKIANQKD